LRCELRLSHVHLHHLRELPEPESLTCDESVALAQVAAKIIGRLLCHTKAYAEAAPVFAHFLGFVELVDASMPDPTPRECRGLMSRLTYVLSDIWPGGPDDDSLDAHWRPLWLILAWTCACALLEQDGGVEMPEDVAGVVIPIAFHKLELIQFPDFVRRLPAFVELTGEDRDDFVRQSSIFYMCAFLAVGQPGGQSARPGAVLRPRCLQLPAGRCACAIHPLLRPNRGDDEDCLRRDRARRRSAKPGLRRR
jgi:hypothetical protein